MCLCLCSQRFPLYELLWTTYLEVIRVFITRFTVFFVSVGVFQTPLFVQQWDRRLSLQLSRFSRIHNIWHAPNRISYHDSCETYTVKNCGRIFAYEYYGEIFVHESLTIQLWTIFKQYMLYLLNVCVRESYAFPLFFNKLKYHQFSSLQKYFIHMIV